MLDNTDLNESPDFQNFSLFASIDVLARPDGVGGNGKVK